MAVETIELNAGSGGASVAVDTVSAASYQLIKIAAGGDGDAAFAATAYSNLADASSDQDSTVVKASAAVLYSLEVSNTNSAARYVKIYNKATGPTSADTPVFRFAIPGAGGIALAFPHGKLFATGLSFRLTTGAADNDANAVAASEIMTNMSYV
jgi:hypothetical protein